MIGNLTPKLQRDIGTRFDYLYRGGWSFHQIILYLQNKHKISKITLIDILTKYSHEYKKNF